MNLLARAHGHEFRQVVLSGTTEFVNPFSGRPFHVLIWDHEGRASKSGRARLARTLISAGCCCAVCGGETCETWHDILDEVIVMDRIEVPAACPHAFMTTWHQGETPEKVAFFFVHCTRGCDSDCHHHLILHIGSGPQLAAVDTAVLELAGGRRDEKS